MKQFLTFSLACFPLMCLGAPSISYTSYFNNVHVYTNITLGGVTRNTWPSSSGTAGTVINTGASTVGAVPRYTDTTGTNVAPSTTFNLGTSTNATLTGNLLANGGVFTNGITAGASTFTGAAGFADGTAAAPSIFWTSDNDASGTGIYRGAANQVWFAANGVAIGNFYSGGLSLGTTSVGFGVNAFSVDSLFGRDGAAGSYQLGADSATAAAQTLEGPDGLGTDKIGGALQLGGGDSTGTAAGGPVILQTANSAGASGSSQNTTTERFHAIAKWVTLTSATATTIFTITVPATNYVGLTATVTVYATDGTDHQSKTSVITCDAINKAGTITETLTQVDNTTAASSGTLTATYDSVDAGSNVVGIRVAADSSLTETVLRAKIVITAINSNGAATVTEQ